MSQSKIEKQIAALTDAVQKLIDNLVAPVAPVAPIAPIIPQHTGDHDLLVTLNSQMGDLKVAVNSLITREDSHITKDELTTSLVDINRIQVDHETRTRSLESFRDTLMGKMIALSAMSGTIVGFILLVINHIWK